ncbi:MAG TPA: hypothetical protein VNH11_23160 [Pirellulales bacterium]|nr:hypothetical protein [Pirellulales bacterium]
MDVAETLLYVAANAPASERVRAACTTLVMCEDRELRPHPPLEPSNSCGRKAARCAHERSLCWHPRNPCGHAAPRQSPVLLGVA